MNTGRNSFSPLAGLIVLGIVLRFLLLPFSSMWLDEAYTIKVASLSLPEIIEVLKSDNGSPLFYFILHGWMKLFGSGEIACNLLTILISSAALLATARLLTEAFENRRIHWVGIGLMAICPASIHHATNVRFYSLIVLISALSWLWFIRALRRNRAPDWTLFALSSIVGFYEHTLYLFTPFAQFAVLVLFHRKRFLSGFFAFTGIGIGCLPWVPILIIQTLGYTGGDTPDVIPPLSSYGGPAPAYLYSIAERILVFSALTPARLAAAAAMLIFIAVMLIKDRSSNDAGMARNFLFGHLFSVGMLVVISLVRPVFWLDKYDLIALPLVFGLAGFAVSRLPLSRLAIILLLTVNTYGTASYLKWRITGGLTAQRSTIEQLQNEITAHDIVIETGLSHFTVEYYLNELGVQTGPRYVFPAEQKTRPAMINPEALIEQHEALTAEAFHLLEKLRNSDGRIFVFRSPLKGLAPLYDALDEAFVLEKTIPVHRHTWGTMYSEVAVYRLR